MRGVKVRPLECGRKGLQKGVLPQYYYYYYYYYYYCYYYDDDYYDYYNGFCCYHFQVGRYFHGFGTHKTTYLQGTPVSGIQLDYHHGLWEAGVRQGMGLNYSDEGIYTGE